MRLQNILDRIIVYGFYVLFFVTPLLFNLSRTTPSYELFEWNKMAFVYTLTTIISAAWISKLILTRKVRLEKTPFTIPLLLFVGAQALSTLFSIDRHVSIFGYYSRFHGGLLSNICYALLFFAFVANRHLFNPKRLLTIALTSGFIVVVYGILEHFGIDSHLWVQDVRSRVFSTLGQPNWLAAYLTILLPIGIAFSFLSRYSSSERSESRSNFKESSRSASQHDELPSNNKVTGIFFITAVLFYACLLFTKSRSGFLGFWIANAIFWALTFYASSSSTSLKVNSKSKSYINVLPNLFRDLNPLRMLKPASQRDEQVQHNNLIRNFLALNFALLTLNFLIRTPFPQYNQWLTFDIFNRNQPAPIAVVSPPTGDSALIDVGITDSSEIRKIVWKGSFNIIKDYPLFGTGPETFAYAYYKYRPVEHNLTSEWDFLYNRAHNEFLNIAATSGIVGLITYLLFIGTFIVWTVKQIILRVKGEVMSFPRKRESILDGSPVKPGMTILAVGLFAGWLSILITNFFGFSVVVVGIYFFLIPAIVYSMYAHASVNSPSENFSSKKRLLIGGVWLIATISLVTIARFWWADSLYARSYNLYRQNSLEEAYTFAIAATQYRSDEPVYHDQRATVASALGFAALEKGEATAAGRLTSEAVRESGLALETSPQNVNFWKSRTKILYQLSTVDPTFTDHALAAIRIAEELAPTDPKIAYNVAVILGEAKKMDEAIAELNKTIAMKPDYRDAYIALAIFYEQTKDITKARETLELVLTRINPDDAEVKKRLEELK